MSLLSQIAIDGTSGSGKSTTGESLADKINYTFLDSGKLYRAISRQVILNKVTASDEEAVTLLMERLRIDLHSSPKTGKTEIIFHGEELKRQNLYTNEINHVVPIIAAFPEVRKIVRKLQRQIAMNGRVVIAGRDIGTIVLPDADLKIFLEVSLDERVRRRYLSMKHSVGITEEEIRKDLIRRDEIDGHRSESPMKIPEDAIIVKTDNMEVDEVVNYIIQLMQTDRKGPD